MSQRAIVAIGILLFLILCGAAATGWQLGRSKRAKAMTRANLGGSFSSDGFYITTGNLVIDAPKAGNYFGTITRPGSVNQLSYYVIFKYDPYAREYSSGGSSGSNSGGHVAECKNSQQINGKTMDVTYKIEFAKAGKPGEGETLKLGSQTFDVNQGRLFLIDLTETTPTYRQKNVPLPPVSTKLTGSAEVQKVAAEVQADLARQDREIEAFLKN